MLFLLLILHLATVHHHAASKVGSEGQQAKTSFKWMLSVNFINFYILFIHFLWYFLTQVIAMFVLYEIHISFAMCIVTILKLSLIYLYSLYIQVVQCLKGCLKQFVTESKFIHWNKTIFAVIKKRLLVHQRKSTSLYSTTHNGVRMIFCPVKRFCPE